MNTSQQDEQQNLHEKKSEAVVSGETVVIVGASHKPERYAYKAMKMLEEYGHHTILMNPRGGEIEGHVVFTSLAEISAKLCTENSAKVDTVTLYVGEERSSILKDELISLSPRRVIFNPGAENPLLQAALQDAGIEPVEACTLVLLRTKQF